MRQPLLTVTIIRPAAPRSMPPISATTATAATGASDPPRLDFRRRSVMTTPVGGLGAMGGMGAWVRGLRSATLCARTAAPPGSPPAHPARMDWQLLSK